MKLLSNLLTKFLPRRYSIGSGIVIDTLGHHSKQIDIIVYDSYYHPELFSQGAAASLYPVDVVYMTIEVKTMMTKDEMKKAIENADSIKQLKFIESPIQTLNETPQIPGAVSFDVTKTSSPIAIIFAFNCETSTYETFESWIESGKAHNEIQLFDLCYILQPTFFYTFQDLDRKNRPSKGINPLPQTVIETSGKLENVKDFDKYKDDVQIQSLFLTITKEQWIKQVGSLIS